MASDLTAPIGRRPNSAARLHECLHDRALHARLAATSARMRSQDGPAKAARLLAGPAGLRVRRG